MAATAGDQSADPAARVWVRGRAVIARGYEGASLGVADVLADQALALCTDRPSLGLLNAVHGKAHAAAVRGARTTALTLDERGRHIFDTAGSYEQDLGLRDVLGAAPGVPLPPPHPLPASVRASIARAATAMDALPPKSTALVPPPPTRRARLLRRLLPLHVCSDAPAR
ncbi:hypothetical protein [Streptomyces sp. NPDC031705]|uniref:hypothetical protein n=1 Tax=Streptomyces sp. NPDC031705 TaxID=3155729 RepID=UPI0033C2A692